MILFYSILVYLNWVSVRFVFTSFLSTLVYFICWLSFPRNVRSTWLHSIALLLANIRDCGQFAYWPPNHLDHHSCSWIFCGHLVFRCYCPEREPMTSWLFSNLLTFRELFLLSFNRYSKFYYFQLNSSFFSTLPFDSISIKWNYFKQINLHKISKIINYFWKYFVLTHFVGF